MNHLTSTRRGGHARPAVAWDAFTGSLGGAVARSDRLLARIPFYPLLFAAYPVLLLYSNNVTEVDASEVVPPMALILIVTAIGYGVLALIWRSTRRAAIVTSAAVIPCLSFGFMVAAIEPAWPDYPLVRSELVALLVWVVAFFLSISIAARMGRRLATLTQAMNVVALALVVLVLLPIAGYALWPAGPSSAKAIVPVRTAAAVVPEGPQRDIYHLVFDRYGSEEALRVGPGIDNSEFMTWLRAEDFQVVDDARANYWRTVPSLSSAFNMSLHDDLAAQMGSDNPNPRPLLYLLRNNPAAATLQQLGYQYLHIGGQFHQFSRSDIADHVEIPETEISFGSTLRGNTAMPFVSALLNYVTVGHEESLRGFAHATQVQIERVEAMADVRGPKLVYAHFMLPHEPFVFLEDGTFAPDKATYETQLRFANSQIRRLVEPLLALPDDEQPIIIIQADEGPYPDRYAQDKDAFDWTTATDEELLAKFGIISAWYLPGPEGEEALSEGLSLVNTYPELLQRYFDLPIPRAPDRSYASREGRLYDHIDITDLLVRATRRIKEGAR